MTKRWTTDEVWMAFRSVFHRAGEIWFPDKEPAATKTVKAFWEQLQLELLVTREVRRKVRKRERQVIAELKSQVKEKT